MFMNSDTIHKAQPDWHFPDFELKQLKPKTNEYCICVFVINEGEKIIKQMKAMAQYADVVDIIIADGGSTDGAFVAGNLKAGNVTALLTKKGPGRLSAQMRMAFAYALSAGYEGVIVVDGNGKDDITAIPNFINLLSKGYDHIQGSRYIPGGRAINTPLERHLGLKLLHAPLISLAARQKHTDTTNGFRAYSASLLSDKDVSVFRDVFQTYELHYYLAIESSRREKFKTTETPVTRRYPEKGKTPTKISPIKGNVKIAKILFSAALGFYKPKQK